MHLCAQLVLYKLGHTYHYIIFCDSYWSVNILCMVDMHIAGHSVVRLRFPPTGAKLCIAVLWSGVPHWKFSELYYIYLFTFQQCLFRFLFVCCLMYLTTTEMRCFRKAAGKTRMDKIRNEEIRRRVNMQPAEQTANKNKIRWWLHVKRMAPTAPHSKALVIHLVGKTTKGKATKSVGRWCSEMVQGDWDPDDRCQQLDVRLYIHLTPIAEECV